VRKRKRGKRERKYEYQECFNFSKDCEFVIKDVIRNEFVK